MPDKAKIVREIFQMFAYGPASNTGLIGGNGIEPRPRRKPNSYAWPLCGDAFECRVVGFLMVRGPRDLGHKRNGLRHHFVLAALLPIFGVPPALLQAPVDQDAAASGILAARVRSREGVRWRSSDRSEPLRMVQAASDRCSGRRLLAYS